MKIQTLVFVALFGASSFSACAESKSTRKKTADLQKIKPPFKTCSYEYIQAHCGTLIIYVLFSSFLCLLFVSFFA